MQGLHDVVRQNTLFNFGVREIAVLNSWNFALQLNQKNQRPPGAYVLAQFIQLLYIYNILLRYRLFKYVCTTVQVFAYRRSSIFVTAFKCAGICKRGAKEV